MLSRDQITMGEALAHFDRLLIVRKEDSPQLHDAHDLAKLELDLFGYAPAFTRDQNLTGRFGELTGKGRANWSPSWRPVPGS